MLWLFRKAVYCCKPCARNAVGNEHVDQNCNPTTQNLGLYNDVTPETPLSGWWQCYSHRLTLSACCVWNGTYRVRYIGITSSVWSLAWGFHRDVMTQIGKHATEDTAGHAAVPTFKETVRDFKSFERRAGALPMQQVHCDMSLRERRIQAYFVSYETADILLCEIDV